MKSFSNAWAIPSQDGTRPLYKRITKLDTRENLGVEYEAIPYFPETQYEFTCGLGKKYQYTYPAREIGIYKNTLLFPWVSLGMTGDSVIFETGKCQSAIAEMFMKEHFRNYPIRRVSGYVTSIGHTHNWGQYYHMTVDMVARLGALHHPRLQRLPKIWVCVGRELEEFAKPIVKELLPPNAEIIPSIKSERIRPDAFVSIPFVVDWRTAYFPKEIKTQFLASVFRAYGVSSHRKRERKIYLSREFAGHRRILNEYDVSCLLGKYGYETVCNEELSMKEQIMMYSETSHLIGMHGAGLTNLLYMPCGSKVMEISPKAFEDRNYEFLSYSCDHRYFLMNLGLGNLHEDCHVPIRKLKRMVKQMEAS